VRLLALLLAALPIGHSVDGRAIRPVVLGDPAAAVVPAGTEIVVVPSVRVSAVRKIAVEGVRR
jgi:hypothetical protein